MTLDEIEERSLENAKTKKGSRRRAFPGGCLDRPDSPVNGHLRCSTDSGCIATCNFEYKFPNGVTQLAVTCQNGVWRIHGAEWNSIPHCEPICVPECQNGGMCIAPHLCDCPERFTGTHCQFENRPCLNYPVSVANSRRRCDSKFCTVTCAENFAFPDGSTVANLVCKDGDWQPSKAGWISIPDCQPVCDPPCRNGGNCLPRNACQCPQEYRGPQCQYRSETCAPEKLEFNGGFYCTGNDATFECTLSCPLGASFEFPPADVYICTYDRGTFEPRPVPRCKFEENVNVVSSVDESYHSTTYVHATNRSWLVQNFESSGTKGGRGVSIARGKTSAVVEIRKEAKSCFVWGKSHYQTFDGRILSLESDCSHVLLQDKREGILTVAARSGGGPNCESSSSSSSPSPQGEGCFRRVRFFVRGKEYALSIDKETKEPRFSHGKRSLPIPARLPPGLHVEMSAHFVIVKLDMLGVRLTWDGKLFLQIEASEALWNDTIGLCGTMNGDPRDDAIDRSGNYLESVATLASAWKLEDIGEICNERVITDHACASNAQLFTDAAEFCTALLSDSRFRACRDTVENWSELTDACAWDYCTCDRANRKECACETMNVYVRRCAHEGLVSLAGWRNNETCPMFCENGRIYSSCGPKEQATCGDGVERWSSFPEENCEEGCFCPEGTVLHDGKCISPEECPCKLRGKIFAPGASVPKDCNTCTCVSGKWICTQTRCAARCAALGDPHYITFDGKRYDFMGRCEYYLLKGDDDYSIVVANVACSGAISESMGLVPRDAPSCTNTVTIRWKDVLVKLGRNRGILVNGEEVTKLPSLAGRDVKIRAASSIFVLVELPNGLQIWWDGVSRVYANAPPSFHGKTQGLCGTFNANQNDDFLTPDGDIERTASPFAEKWKVDDRCVNVQENETESRHPCDRNPQKRAAATEHCSKLLSDIFSECHWHVDPQPYYEDCLFDVCSCEADVNVCLCPMLSAYAKECASVGVKLLWRDRIDECRIHCTGGQIYRICGNSCTRSCSDISFDPNCRQECVEGCNCPEGQTLDAHGECILIGQCPCAYMGLEFRPGYRETRPGRRARELCICSSGKWECRTATAEEIREYPGSSELSEVCVASKHLQLSECVPVEPRTCRNMHTTPKPTSLPCKSGCVCQPGYVLDTPGGVCVEETACPCHHAGKSYAQGEVVRDNCNLCECANGKWNCTERVCAGVCSAWGDSHFKTFDGKLYNFEGACDYVLAKSAAGKEESFDVSIQNVPCGTSGATCSKSVTLTIGNGDDRESIVLTRGKDLPTGTFRSMTTRTAGLFVFVDVPDLGVVLQWDRGTRIYVRLNPKWKGRTRGLCGDYNDNAEDDFQTPYGGISEASASLFGDSWKRNDYCRAPPDNAEDPCELRPERKLWAMHKCGILKSELFRSCHSEVPVEPYLKNCVFDACGCDSGGDCECLCTALAAYAHECNARGVPIKWRSQELCPMQCQNQNGSAYSPCMETCPRETCDSVTTIKNKLHLCEGDTCVEGCSVVESCPDNYVYSNSSYVECVPRTSCRPFCMEILGKTIYEGEQVSGDDCHTCYCSRGKVICSGEPCEKQTEQSVTPMSEEAQKCVGGWTGWINKDVAIKGKKVSDVEPLPTMEDMVVSNGSAICNEDDIVDIRCRSAKDHLNPKETGLDVECSLERGLYCRPQPGSPCIDFEISVLCRCDTTATKEPIGASATTEGSRRCDPASPNEPHPTDCRLFYQCVPGILGSEFVEKSCGPNMFYNPRTYICDWPASVELVRPECTYGAARVSSTTMTTTTTTTSIVTDRPLVTSPCKDGETWSDCAIRCERTCEYYRYVLSKRGHCLGRSNCIAGCTSIDAECPENKFWRDDETCVVASDCACRSHNGSFVKPGAVVRESECEICQCIDNYYTCDDSFCKSTEIHAHTESLFPENTWYTSSASTSESPISSSSTSETAVTKKPIVIPSTVTPPSPCESGDYVPLIRYLSPGNVSFDVSTGEYRVSQDFSVSWESEVHNSDQWIDIVFPIPEAVYAIVVRGSATQDEFVTSYRVLYSENGHAFAYVLDDEKNPLVFRGPMDADRPVEQRFRVPFEAKVVRINPLSWHGRISVRAEVLGCQERLTSMGPDYSSHATPAGTTPVFLEKLVEPACSEPMGVEDGSISAMQVSSSSSLYHPLLPSLRLSSSQPWRPKLDNPHQFVRIDFLEPRNLTGIVTKGGDDSWTTVYTASYSLDGRHWNSIIDDAGREKEFLANFDANSVKRNIFDRPVRARFLKIQPRKWNNHVALKVEALGCFEAYHTSTTTESVFHEKASTTEVPEISTIAPEGKCDLCPGVSRESGENCDCQKPYSWNGTFCVLEHQCPCVEGSVRYTVGSVYENEKCERCICTLGGVAACSAKKCDACPDPRMRSIVTELCACVCKPCPDGTRRCPTSDACIDEKSWCNGIQDCPDDEVDCESSITAPSSTGSHRVETYNVTATTVTNHTTVRVVTTTCLEPTCPPGYKTIYTDNRPSWTPNTTERSVKGFVKGKRFRKKSFESTGTNATRRGVYETELPETCPRFTCVPVKPPPTLDQTKTEVCPEASCPLDYTVVYEQMSMYKLSKCPRYTCKPPPPREVICNVTGRTFDTFDGTEYKYDICNHVLAREMFRNKWYIALEKQQCKQSEPCRENLVIVIDDDVLVLHTDMRVEINGRTFSPIQIKRLGSGGIYGSFKISCVGDSIFFASDRYGFWLSWESNANVKIGASLSLAKRVDGLCGYLDGYAPNDKQKPDGSQAKSTIEFGDSWRIDEAEECETQLCDRETLRKASEMCAVAKDPSFAPCFDAVNLDKFLSRCAEESCECLRGDGSNRTHDECRCRALADFVAECRDAGGAAAADFDSSQWRILHDCPVACPPPFVYKDCFRSSCERTCANLREIEPCTPVKGVCFPGCFCPDGMVRDDERCVPATECRDCVCEGFGHSKFITFDKKSYDFAGNCTYVLARDAKNEMQSDAERKFQVLLSRVRCNASICGYGITVLYRDYVVEIVQQELPSKELRVTLNGVDAKKLPAAETSWFDLEEKKHVSVVLTIPEIQLEITLFWRNFAFTVKLPSHVFGDAVEGLCGNCNGDLEDDFRRADDGEITEDANSFGKSWTVEASPSKTGRTTDGDCAIVERKNCSHALDEENPCESLLDLSRFGGCHDVVDVKPYLELCRDSVCANGTYCDSLEAYARHCSRAGFCLDWRTPEICPYRCPPHLEYRACGSVCRSSCNDVDEGNATKCRTEFPEEGCFCPRDLVLRDNACVPREKCRICDTEGHVEGDVWSPDKCTTCSCDRRTVACRKKECPIMETACPPDTKRVPVSGTEEDCCPKYVCVPAPPQTSTCPEIQQPDCGFGQEMKLSTDVDGCRRFACQCLPPEKCPPLEITPEAEGESEIESELEPGFVRVTNTSGCCPRWVLVCQAELCPSIPKCPPGYEILEEQSSTACCPNYKCEPPKDACPYDTATDNWTFKKVGEEWVQDKCTMCSCDRFETGTRVTCVSSTCPTVEDHPDANDFVLEEASVENNQCCPKYKRTACKHAGRTYEIGASWQPLPGDACATMECVEDHEGIRKQTRVQECNVTCDYGYRYEPPVNANVTCCGKCVAFGCVIGKELKNIGDSWYSDDHCAFFSCRYIDDKPSVSVITETCSDLDETEQEDYTIEKRFVPGKCCPEFVRTACRHGGNVYEPGDRWISPNDSCVVETCVLEPRGIMKYREIETCTTDCPLGYVYREANESECCGRCEEAYCVVNGVPRKPGEIWSSENGCETYSCTRQNEQLSIIGNSMACPNVSDCPVESIYEDACCKRCNSTMLERTQACTIKIWSSNDTIGIVTEKHRVHGICENLAPLEGLAECRGTCESSTYFDERWNHATDCSCCQPTEFQTVVAVLTCSDGKIVKKTLSTPRSCSCTACGSVDSPKKQRYHPVH